MGDLKLKAYRDIKKQAQPGELDVKLRDGQYYLCYKFRDYGANAVIGAILTNSTVADAWRRLWAVIELDRGPKTY